MKQFVTDEEERLTPPEAEDPGVVAFCEECREPIFEGDVYGEEKTTGRTVCAYCLEDAWENGYTIREKFELLGFRMIKG